MPSWYELSGSKDHQFRFVLKAANSEIILTSELYRTKASAENGIASVRANKVAKGEDVMNKTHEPNTSVTRGDTQGVARRKSWRLAIALWVSLAAVTAGSIALPSVAQAADRLTDKEVEELLASVEKSRSRFEAALDKGLKNTIMQGARGDVNTNEFFDDLQDQVSRTRERFKKDYSASSEVIALLGYATRLETWVGKQPAGFQGSNEWNPFASDLHRLAKAYNTSIPMPTGGIARRYNDNELIAAAANVERMCGPFRSALDANLSSKQGLTPGNRAAALQQVDALTTHAHALNQSLANKQKGVAEADMLIRQGLTIVDWISKNPISSSTNVKWAPLRRELGKIAFAYEVNNRNLPVQ